MKQQAAENPPFPETFLPRSRENKHKERKEGKIPSTVAVAPRFLDRFEH